MPLKVGNSWIYLADDQSTRITFEIISRNSMSNLSDKIIRRTSSNNLLDVWKVKMTYINPDHKTITSIEYWVQHNDSLEIYRYSWQDELKKVVLLEDGTVATEIIESHWKPAIAFVWPCKINTIKDWGEYTTTLSEKNVNYNNYTKCLKYHSENNEYKDSSLDFIIEPGLGFVKDRTGKLIETNVTKK